MLKYFMKYFENISVFNEIFQNALPFLTPCLFLPHGVMAQNLVMLNTRRPNCVLLVKSFLLSTSTDYLRFPISINQIKNIKSLISWLFKLSPQVTTCSKPQHLQTKSVSLTVTDTDSSLLAENHRSIDWWTFKL